MKKRLLRRIIIGIFIISGVNAFVLMGLAITSATQNTHNFDKYMVYPAIGFVIFFILGMIFVLLLIVFGRKLKI